MKKFILSLIFLAISTAAFSQAQFGIKGGVTVAKLTNLDKRLSKAKAGFYTGLLLDIYLSDYIGLQPELVYSRQGVTAWVDRNYRANLNFDYLNIPLILKIYLGNSFSFDVGPQLGFLVNTQATSRGNKKISVIYDGNTNEADFAMAFGFSCKMGRRVDFSARYNMGVVSVNKGNSGESRNSVFQFGLGVRLTK